VEEATIREAVARWRAGEPFALALLTDVQGSAPQKPGARLLVFPSGATRGTVGGGCLEMEARRRALLALPERTTETFTLRLDDDFGWDDGLICGGFASITVCADPDAFAPALEAVRESVDRGERVRLATNRATGAARILTEGEIAEEGDFVEEFGPPPTLYVLGCGHVGAALVPLAATVGFRVVAIDDRADYADPLRLPAASETRCTDLVDAAKTLPTDAHTFWVIVTRGHRNDGRVLSEVLKRPFGYVGMIGSRRKVRLIKEGIRAEGVCTEETLERLHAPIGLSIGAVTPQEIALSIAAELVQVRHLVPLPAALPSFPGDPLP
jgi:xanthine dehydrogenase accessory factor